jgi:glyoxylase-like metal-dependent hydrolase (beta-lactamase superfamily II)
MSTSGIPAGERIVVEHFPVGELACNCTIVADRATGEAIVVDGGDDVDEIAARLDALGVRATQLVHTHAHFDHIGALAELRERVGGHGLLHPADLPLYATLAAQARFFGLRAPSVVRLDGDLLEGDRLRVGEAVLEVLHTPGHTPGSISLALQFEGSTRLLSGDTLFRGSVGRWDLGGTSLEDIVDSIRTKLFAFADATVVVPGHGPATTIGIERATNPFLVPSRA